MAEDLIVITGGPGSGKTTLITLLGDAGFSVAPEAGRAIIRDQTMIDGRGLPWVDRALFAELMLCWDIRSWHWAQLQPGLVFFDHAIPGLPGYYRLAGQRVPGHVETAVSAFRYRAEVFVAPPWPEIYRNDAERHQDFGEAERTHEALVDAYARGGYHLVDLPLAVPVERLRFVLGRVGLPVDAGPGGGGPRHRR